MVKSISTQAELSQKDAAKVVDFFLELITLNYILICQNLI
ncbi:hypothetical protein B4102_1203 [Heyndrickxia sporothermodurans]|uniref:Uncharacterized protein n=1 Tax=Heyndrickxia sporothermodurans TaxID=46224 RepID=A0A150KNR0_9BACI|nr:hypothetical protein B4102_1203 [Heyndrickxia sporothermodurans]